VKWLFLLGLLALVCFDTTGQLGFKLTADRVGPAVADLAWVAAVLARPSFYMTLGSYLGAFAVYMTLMRHVAVGPLFAASHLELITVTAVSVLWFGERFNGVQALGCLLILGGVVLLGFSERNAETQ
jgi:drug/metabolite transporter (DMT)-like permease